ncbi:putative ribonuclease H-like domain-containing protein [Tanacetum coccineum]|uniref:Ribonuclease H-like domain-containing protein n=1 Tax=Tanacetum coccineum TaxID=301880 RepID=A0ABQ4X4S5_9ASTR
MRMEQYLTHTDYALWEVIVNGDAPVVASASAEGPIPPKTAEQNLARKNELKAKSTLLLAIPDEHLLKFHGIKYTKTLWEAINARFGGNKELKKMQKTILKQQYENFAASRSEGLDKTYDRNKYDLNTLSMDDSYNNLKVYEAEIKGQSSSSLNSHNVAFISLENTSNTNEAVNTAHEVSTASSQGQASSSTYADDIDTDNLEEMDLKWQVAMLTIRVKRFLKKTGRNLNFNGKETVGFDKTKVECYNCHMRGHFARECRAPRNQGNRNRDAPRRIVPVETPTNALVVQDGIGGYDWSFQAEEGITNFALMAYTSQGYQMGLESLEARIVVHEKNEAVYEEDIAFLKYDVQVKDISIKDLKNQLEETLKEKDDLKLKLEKFEDSSKNLTKLINSQISAKDKAGLGEGFHAVPPPYTGNYMPSRPDLSFAGLDDSVYKTKVSETITTASKTSKDNLEKPKTVRPSAPIIEDWDTDSDNDSVFRPKSDQTKPKFTKINFVKSDENVKSINKENTHRQVEYPRKSQSPRDNRRNWNGLMTQKLGNGFESIKKACFVCGSFNHLIKDCDFHDKKMVEKPVLNNKGRVTGQREIRPVWNNAQRVNHQNKFTHPHPKRNFVPTAVVTKSGQVPVNTAKQSSPNERAAAQLVLPGLAFNQKSAAKTNKFNEKVNTARVNNVTTAGPKAVVSAAVGNGENAVKSSACWIWRPTGNGNPQYTLQDQGIFDSGCSRHMTGNKSFLIDYQEIDGGFVAFGGSPKGVEERSRSKGGLGRGLWIGLTCLFAKATIDESNLWHRRLGHINFKTMNKLVKGNLVRGLPLKLFENDHTCVACQKGKQHKASCKTKLVSSISQPLQMLHMDLFGPTSVRSINHKTYCLVVTDDYSRFSWVFFLATKDETSGILKTFITGIENQINHKVKIIRCDNGTEFKNNDMNQFCGIKGIKREFSVARTPQQNGVAKRKNRTLIEAARTMLADSLLPTTFWAEVVNTACYVQNRIPYGEFDEKADEGFFVGYSINSKTFKIFNTRTRKVEEYLHINFLENKPNVAGSGPDWLFDIDLLTNSMNYEPVTAGNQTNIV